MPCSVYTQEYSYEIELSLCYQRTSWRINRLFWG